MKQLILVEGKNDKYFLQALLQEMNLLVKTEEIEDATSNENQNDRGLLWGKLQNIRNNVKKNYDSITQAEAILKDFSEILLTEMELSLKIEPILTPIDGSDKSKIINKLSYIRKRIHAQYSELQHIGIVLDADDLGTEARLNMINEAIEIVFGVKESIKNENEITEVIFSEQGIEAKLNFIFHCIKVAGKGELFTLLRHIKKKEPSHYSDCLVENWQKCYEKKEIPDTHKITENDFDKFWVEVYLKFDTVQRSKRDRNSASLQHVFNERGRESFNFESEHLKGLKDFLGLFR